MKGFERAIEVLTWGIDAKKKLVAKGITQRTVRVVCPNKDHSDPRPYIHIGVWGKKNHVHLACEDPACPYHMME